MTDAILWLLYVTAVGAFIILIKNITMKLSELKLVLDGISDSLVAISDQLAKATDEIIAALSNVEIPADASATLDGLKALAATLKAEAQKLDDLNADAPPQ